MDGAGEPFIWITEEGFGFIGLKREVAGDGHAWITAADGERQLVMFGEFTHFQRAFDNAILEDILCLDQKGDGLGAVGIDGLCESRIRICLEFRRKGNGKGAIASGQVMVEQREGIEEFIARCDSAWAGWHDADGVTHDKGCFRIVHWHGQPK